MSIWTGEAQGEQLLLRLFNNASMSHGVTSFLVEPNTGWLFVGLFSGQIKAFQQKPETELVLKGHESAVTQMCRRRDFSLFERKTFTYGRKKRHLIESGYDTIFE